MNAVNSVFAGLDDDDLRVIVRELAHMNGTGVLPEGRTRDLAKELMSRTGLNFSAAFTIACQEPLRVGAMRWAGVDPREHDQSTQGDVSPSPSQRSSGRSLRHARPVLALLAQRQGGDIEVGIL